MQGEAATTTMLSPRLGTRYLIHPVQYLNLNLSSDLWYSLQVYMYFTCNPTDGTGQAGKKRMTLVQNVRTGIETQRILSR